MPEDLCSADAVDLSVPVTYTVDLKVGLFTSTDSL